ncbi:MAG: esterase/lipase family protein [Candidatus Binatia bacterium]
MRRVAPVRDRAAVVFAASLLLGAPAAAWSFSSPFAPPEESDRVFLVDEGPGLDTGCTYRSGGPLEFAIPIDRYVGETDGNGNLRNAGSLVSEGIVSASATLNLPAFDVDDDAPSQVIEVEGVEVEISPEHDRVYLNGEPLGALDGADGQWRLNTFTVPIEKLRFPSARGANGAPPDAALNTVTIDIDVDNTIEAWCVSIDWGALDFKAMSPVILIHGNSSNGAFWERQGFVDRFEAIRLPFDNSISMSNATVADHGDLLSALIPPIVASFGVDSVHLVAHSKGGLDSRDYLATFYDDAGGDFEVLSLTTVSTPHRGTSAADLGMAVDQGLTVFGVQSGVNLLAALVGVDAGTPNLTTWFAQGFNATNVPSLPAGIDYRAVGADADRNGSDTIDLFEEYESSLSESSSLSSIQSVSSSMATDIMNKLYRLLRETARVDIIGDPAAGYALGQAIPGGAPNDTLVPIPSALGPNFVPIATFTGLDGRDHAAVADADVAAAVVPQLKATESANGDFQ